MARPLKNAAQGAGVLLITARPAVHTFIARAAERAPQPFALWHVPPGERALEQRRAQLGTVIGAVVDLAPDPPLAIQLCRELRQEWPELPILALLCCAGAATPFEVQELAGAGVQSLLDLQASA